MIVRATPTLHCGSGYVQFSGFAPIRITFRMLLYTHVPFLPVLPARPSIHRVGYNSDVIMMYSKGKLHIEGPAFFLIVKEHAALHLLCRWHATDASCASIFGNVWCTQTWYLGRNKVSCLERCPYFRGVLIEGYHCSYTRTY